MNSKVKEILSSYIRHFVAIGFALLAGGVTDWKALLIATLAATIGPTIRAIDPSDPAFGLIADKVDVELDKLAKKTTKKAAPKKK
jgi:hypothetical protein